jgi:uncharacterized protein YndB with AHSA1/START domain
MREGKAIMKEQSVVHSTFVIERSYPKPPAAVFAAFADATKKQGWYVDRDSNTVEEYSLDFREGGGERLRYRLGESTPLPGMELTNIGEFKDIVPDERIVESMTMLLGENRISASLVTIEFLATETGTDLIFTHQGAFFEGSGGPQMREAGWKGLFNKLEKELARQ